MKLKNELKAAALVVGVMLIGVFAFVTTNETSTDDLAIHAQSSTEMLASNHMDFEGKCGEGEAEEGEGENAEESKEAEGKKKASKKSKKKKEEKKEEAKCGEGKCGGQ